MVRALPVRSLTQGLLFSISAAFAGVIIRFLPFLLPFVLGREDPYILSCEGVCEKDIVLKPEPKQSPTAIFLTWHMLLDITDRLHVQVSADVAIGQSPSTNHTRRHPAIHAPCASTTANTRRTLSTNPTAWLAKTRLCELT